jgi:hypothetical protein
MPKTWTPEQQAALRLLDDASTEYQAAEQTLDQKRTRLHEAVAAALRTEVGPSEVTRHTPYDRQHVARIRDEAGIPAKPRPGQGTAGHNEGT